MQRNQAGGPGSRTLNGTLLLQSPPSILLANPSVKNKKIKTSRYTSESDKNGVLFWESRLALGKQEEKLDESGGPSPSSGRVLRGNSLPSQHDLF